jgi:hypothetical protein
MQIDDIKMAFKRAAILKATANVAIQPKFMDAPPCFFLLAKRTPSITIALAAWPRRTRQLGNVVWEEIKRLYPFYRI